MGKFSYWQAGDSIDYEIPNGTELTDVEAQVIATAQLSHQVEKAAAALEGILYVLQHNSISVDNTN